MNILLELIKIVAALSFGVAIFSAFVLPEKSRTKVSLIAVSIASVLTLGVTATS